MVEFHPQRATAEHAQASIKNCLIKADDLQTKVQAMLTDERKQLLEELQKMDGQVGSIFEEEKFKE